MRRVLIVLAGVAALGVTVGGRAANPYAGSWSGTWTIGEDGGGILLTVNNNGNVTGQFLEESDTLGIALRGRITSNGEFLMNLRMPRPSGQQALTGDLKAVAENAAEGRLLRRLGRTTTDGSIAVERTGR